MEEHLLAIVLDTNLTALAANEDENIGGVVDALITFCSSHLMLSPSNRVTLIASHDHTNTILFPDEADESAALADGDDKSDQQRQHCQSHYESFSQHRSAIGHRLRTILLQQYAANGGSSDQTAPAAATAPLASALATCLCHVHRARQHCPPGLRLLSRLLVLTAQGASTRQYMDFMNVFFTAQKMSVPMDACLLGAVQSGILQQGADITGGLCQRVARSAGLLQYLVWLFLPWAEERRQLTLPAPPLVDYRAACFCHRQLVSVGFVCSVCLSIFCKYAPICSTCHTVFKVRPPPPSTTAVKSSKKRKK